MDREILFRGKTPDGIWVEGYYFKSWNKSYILWESADDSPSKIEVLPETVGQFTGLLDKAGEKIFEGDVVKTNKLEGGLCNLEFEGVVWQVKWIAGGFMLVQKTPKKIQVDAIHIGRLSELELEIIGNIHDNPSLL